MNKTPQEMSDKVLTMIKKELNFTTSPRSATKIEKLIAELEELGFVCIPIIKYQNEVDGFEYLDLKAMAERFDKVLDTLESDQDFCKDVWSEKQEDYAKDSQ